MAEPFPGYAEAIAGVQGQASMPPDAGGMDERMLQLLMQNQQEAPEPAQKTPPKWMYFLPGFGRGFAQGKVLEAQEQELKLRKQDLAGRKANQQLQQLMLQQKIQQQQARKRWAGLYGGLIRHDDILDDTSRNELEGTLAEEMAQAGELDLLTKFEEQRRARRVDKQLDQIVGAQPEAPSAAPPAATMPDTEDAESVEDTEGAEEPAQFLPGAMTEDAPDTEAGDGAPALRLPPVQVTAGRLAAPAPDLMRQDALRLRALATRQATLEAQLRGLRKLGGTSKRADRLLADTRQELGNVQKAMASLEKKGQFSGSPIEQVTGVPQAYLTREDVTRGGQELLRRRVQVAQQNQAAGLGMLGAKTLEAAISKPLTGEAATQLETMTKAEAIIQALTSEFTPAERATFVGLGGAKFKGQQLQQLLDDATSGKADPKFARFAALIANAKAEAFTTGGKALTETEKAIVFGYIPTGAEASAEAFEQKLALTRQRLPALIDWKLAIATTPAKDLARQRASGALQPQLPPPTAVPGEPASPSGGFRILSIEKEKP